MSERFNSSPNSFRDNNLRGFTASDITTLHRLLRDYRHQNEFREIGQPTEANSIYQDDSNASQVYLVQSPHYGIPAATITSGEENEFIPGTALCTVYTYTPSRDTTATGTFNPVDDFQKWVLNISDQAISPKKWCIAKKDAYGNFLVDNGDTSILTGTGTLSPSPCIGCGWLAGIGHDNFEKICLRVYVDEFSTDLILSSIDGLSYTSIDQLEFCPTIVTGTGTGSHIPHTYTLTFHKISPNAHSLILRSNHGTDSIEGIFDCCTKDCITFSFNKKQLCPNYIPLNDPAYDIIRISLCWHPCSVPSLFVPCLGDFGVDVPLALKVVVSYVSGTGCTIDPTGTYFINYSGQRSGNPNDAVWCGTFTPPASVPFWWVLDLGSEVLSGPCFNFGLLAPAIGACPNISGGVQGSVSSFVINSISPLHITCEFDSIYGCVYQLIITGV